MSLLLCNLQRPVQCRYGVRLHSVTAVASALHALAAFPSNTLHSLIGCLHCCCRNKVDLQNKYCYRQAELGIGDCGGLQVSASAEQVFIMQC